MTELFQNVSEEFKKKTDLFFSLALAGKDYTKLASELYEYVKNCATEEERQFCLFYLNLVLEKIKDGSFNNQW